MPRALIHCGSVSWYSEFSVDRARIQASPPTARATATSAVTWT